MFNVYILKSVKFHRYYVGHCESLDVRIKRHNDGQVKSTKAYKPWVLVYSETFFSKQEAFKRERQIKSYKSGEAFKKLIR